MRIAVYLRVSTLRQAQAQSIEQQLNRLREYIIDHGWSLPDENIFRDDGYSGARLNRPGLDRLRDKVRMAEVDCILITSPDRLARNFVHQRIILDEFKSCHCQVEFLDRSISDDPHDQLLLQIQSAVAEYERTLIADRMRRGRLAKYKAGLLLPWSTPPYGYRVDPHHPRDPTGVRIEPPEAAARTANLRLVCGGWRDSLYGYKTTISVRSQNSEREITLAWRNYSRDAYQPCVYWTSLSGTYQDAAAATTAFSNPACRQETGCQSGASRSQ
jgi:site-specific DNA recombinase